MHDICEEAIENATFVCEQHFGLISVPKIELVCDKDLHFPYVPGHLFVSLSYPLLASSHPTDPSSLMSRSSHIIFELLKNSLRATVDFHGGADQDTFPSIKIVVVEGKEDITLKISDEGGGIPRSAMEFIWTYMYTTMEASALEDPNGPSDFTAPMAGFGVSRFCWSLDVERGERGLTSPTRLVLQYGLPLSRLYAKFFGGDLKLISVRRPSFLASHCIHHVY